MFETPQRKQLFRMELRSGDLVCVEEHPLKDRVYFHLHGTRIPVDLEVSQSDALHLISIFCDSTGIKTQAELKEGRNETY